jgi:phage terminase small subunit
MEEQHGVNSGNRRGVAMRGGYRPNSGPKKGAKYKTKGTAKAPTPKKINGIPADIVADAAAENLDPLTYMLKVMNDPSVDPVRRDRMAVSACPFLHPRAGESGKKEGKEERAKEAGMGKFATGRAPLALVK